MVGNLHASRSNDPKAKASKRYDEVGSNDIRDNPSHDLETQDFEGIDQPVGESHQDYDGGQAARERGSHQDYRSSQDAGSLAGRGLKEDAETRDFRGYNTEQRPHPDQRHTGYRPDEIQRLDDGRSAQRQGYRNSVNWERESSHRPELRGSRSHSDDIPGHPQDGFRHKSSQEYATKEHYGSPAKHSASLSDTHTHAQYRPSEISPVEFQNISDELDEARRQLQEKEQNLQAEKEKVKRLQEEALASADRFQPLTDTPIKDMYKQLDGKVLKVCKSLHGLIPQKQQPDQWPQASYWKPFIRPVKFSDKTSRRIVLTGVVWKFLVENIFDQGFSCFGGDLSQKVNEVYLRLFAGTEGFIEQTEGSARWRSLTAEYLKRGYSSDSGTSTSECSLQKQLEDIFTQDLGYDITAGCQTDIKLVIENAEEFNRTLMQQRAAFKMWVPDPCGGDKKKDDDIYLSNNVDDDKKSAGKIWFVIKPGLIKRGTGRGTNFDEDTEKVIMPAFVQLK